MIAFMLQEGVVDVAVPSFPVKIVEYGIVGAVCAALVWLIWFQYRHIQQQQRDATEANKLHREDMKAFVTEHRGELKEAMDKLGSKIEGSTANLSQTIEKAVKLSEFSAVFVNALSRVLSEGNGKKIDPKTLESLVRACHAELKGG